VAHHSPIIALSRPPLILSIAALLLAGGAQLYAADAATAPNANVAADGSAQFTSVQAAVNAAPINRHASYIIHIAPGKYKDMITVPADKPLLRFAGDDADKTILTYDDFADMPGPHGKKLGTRNTASTYLKAADFAAEKITFENTHGLGSQALAVSITGGRCAFRHCRFLGWQDTVLIDNGWQYFESCYINGHVDFIFGASTAYFKNC
jgi:pectinesterase